MNLPPGAENDPLNPCNEPTRKSCPLCGQELDCEKETFGHKIYSITYRCECGFIKTIE